MYKNTQSLKIDSLSSNFAFRLMAKLLMGDYFLVFLNIDDKVFLYIDLSFFFLSFHS